MQPAPVREASNALIVSDSADTRQQIKCMLEHLESRQFSVVKTCCSLDEGAAKLVNGEEFSCVIISNSFPEADLARFIERSRETRGGSKAALLLTVKPDTSDRKLVSSAMVLGFHGVLIEPFTLLGVEELTKLIAKVRFTTTHLRLRAATGLMIAEAMRDAAPAAGGEEPPVDLKAESDECCKRYKDITGETVTVAIVKDIYEKPISKRLNYYNGASRRVREIVGKLGRPNEFLQFKKLLTK